MSTIPFEIQQQVIQCFGKCFYYKDTVETFMRSCEVPDDLIYKDKEKPKFVWAKNVLNKLNQDETGKIIIRKMVTEFYKMRDIPIEVEKRNEGIDALRKLKRLVDQNKSSFFDTSKTNSYYRNKQEKKIKLAQQKATKIDDLKHKFYEQIDNENVQNRGFELEKLIAELFIINDIPFQKSYRNESNTQQIDGYFRFDGSDYLTEIKWDKNKVNSAQISSLKQKVDTKLNATRGFFIAINGFRNEVVKDYSNRDAKIIFMDGEELIHVLEDRISLKEALITN